MTALRRGAATPAVPTRRGAARRGNQRVLFLIALLLAGSGVIRIGDGVSRAMAEQSAHALPEPDAGAGDAAGTVADTPAALIESLKAREEKIAAQERMMADREAALSIANSKIDARLKELAEAEAKLSQTIAIADTAAEEDVGKLVSVYENMKPKEAAPLFQEMAPDFAAGFLSRMRPEAAAAVMASIDPKQAYMISVVLAGRNANAPQN